MRIGGQGCEPTFDVGLAFADPREFLGAFVVAVDNEGELIEVRTEAISGVNTKGVLFVKTWCGGRRC